MQNCYFDHFHERIEPLQLMLCLWDVFGIVDMDYRIETEDDSSRTIVVYECKEEKRHTVDEEVLKRVHHVWNCTHMVEYSF